ncbi:DnaT-like ssDNA-binding domain-containing protein [Pantoea anthophila]|uniref:DnaT-like ssDNA-binding domain-containing protein n=1 Tax=Pantoea anthophila TaxID=470931 RepID=UPI003CEBAD72
MASNWIKMSASLKTHPKVNEIAALLESPAEGSAGFEVSVGGQRGELLTRNVTRCVTVTALLLIWSAASEHTCDGVFRNVDLSYLDVLAEYSGFGEAMAAVGWAVYDAEEHCVILKTDNDESVVAVSKKSSSAERQRRYRQRKRAQKSVTQTVTPNITRNAPIVTQTVTRDVTPGVARYACFNYLRSKTTHKNKNNTYRPRKFPGRSVDNSVSNTPQAVVAQGLRAVQVADADVFTHPSQQPGHDGGVTERNSSAPVQRNSAGVTLRYAQQQMPLGLVNRSATNPELPENKFVMFDGWQPSATFSDTADSIGIKISAAPDRLQLADFVNYWKAESVAYYQVQWEMKLARYVEKGRKHLSSKRSRERRDCTRVSEMNYEIPEGFRGG